jgi:hypothetical protein
MARFKITCCHHCENRSAGCHGSCEEYKTQRAELDATMAEKRKEYETDMSVASFLYESTQKRTKYKHYRNKYRRSR